MGQAASLLAQLVPEPVPVRPYVHPAEYKCVPNVRHYSDGMHKGYSPNLATRIISAVTLAAYISVPHLVMALFVGAFFSWTALALLAGLMATLLLPARPLRLPSVLSSYLFLCWRRYFKFSYLFEVSLDSYEDYIVAQFPHGAFPLGALLGGTFMATQWPEYPCYALAANAAFWVPVWRHVHSWLGTEACTKANFHRLLGMGVRGPLPHRHHHHHHHGHHHANHHHSASKQQQGQEGDAAAGQQQQQPARSAGGTPFNCTAAAMAAAAGGVTAADSTSLAAPAAVSPLLQGPFASAAGLPPRSSLTPTDMAGGSTPRGVSLLQRRTNSAPLGLQRLSAAFSLPASVFRGGGHTLSDTDSTDSDSSSSSSSSSSDGSLDEPWEGPGCSCGSGLRCRRPGRCAAAADGGSASARNSSGGGVGALDMPAVGGGVIVRAYPSSDSGSSCDSRRSSSSSGGDSCCDCCGACSVLAEVHSLPLDAFSRKQQQHSLVTIPSDELEGTAAAAAPAAAVEDGTVECEDEDSSCRLPLLGVQQGHPHKQQQHQQQQRLVARRASSPALTAALNKQQQQQHSQQHLPSPQLSHSHQQEQPQQEQPAAWRVDPATGERKLGVSVGLMVGGIAEMFMIRRDHERIKLKDRKGFVRIAVEHGVDLIPVYMFGVNQCLDFGPPWLQRLSRRMRASLGVIYGVWGLPIPRRVPIFKVTGRPLVVGPPMRKDHPGFAARVDELHAQFCVEIERLYYAHRATYGHGFENRPLVIC